MGDVIFINPTKSSASFTAQTSPSLSERLKAIEQMHPRIDGHYVTGELMPILQNGNASVV